MSQVPSDQVQTDPARQGNTEVILIGLSFMGPVGDAIATTIECSAGPCDPTLSMLPGPSASQVDNVIDGANNIADDVVDLGKKAPVHHIATNKNGVRNPQWSAQFKALFDKGGISLDDAINKLSLPGHTGPHTQAYHQWVYDRLSAAIKGLSKQKAIRAALEAELNAIAEELTNDPSLTKME